MGSLSKEVARGAHLGEVLWRLICSILLDLLQELSQSLDFKAAQVLLYFLTLTLSLEYQSWHEYQRPRICSCLGQDCSCCGLQGRKPQGESEFAAAAATAPICSASLSSNETTFVSVSSAYSPCNSVKDCSDMDFVGAKLICTPDKELLELDTCWVGCRDFASTRIWITAMMCWIILILYFGNFPLSAKHMQLRVVSREMVETKTTPYLSYINTIKPPGFTEAKSLQFTHSRYPVHFKRVPKFALALKTMESFTRTFQEMFLLQLYHLLVSNGAPLSGHSATHTRTRLRRGAKPTIQVPLHGCPNEGYCAVIAIGLENVQEFCVLIDTGSANLAIAATAHPDTKKYFNVTNVDTNFRELATEVTVSYTSGEWSGTLASDMISVVGSQGAAEPSQVYLALIKSSKDFFIRGAEWTGIMGLAYSALAKPDSSVEPYWDSMRKANGMEDVFAIQLCPPLASQPKPGGQLILGGDGDGHFTGTVFYTSIVHEEFYGVQITNMSVGGVQVEIPCSEFNNDKTIVDSGTTDIYLPNKAFNAVLQAFLEYFKNQSQFSIPASFWSGDSKLAWSSSNLQFVFDNFPTMYVGFASQDNESQEFSLAVTPQIYLRKVEGSADDRRDATCHPICDFFVFGIRQRSKGTILGGNVMLGFTAVFDREAGRVGFAKSTCQYQHQTKESIPHIVGPYKRDVVDCKCHHCSGANKVMTAITVLGILTSICIIISIILTIVLHRRTTKPGIETARDSTRKRRSCCQWCRDKKQISQEEEATVTETDNPESSSGSNRRAGNVTESGCFSVLMWIKHARGRLLSKVVQGATPARSVQADPESCTREFPEANSQQNGDSPDRNMSNLDEIGDCNDRADVEDAATLLPPPEHCHQQELVIGKSSYIGESYPKLALSESPHNSLASSHNAHDLEAACGTVLRQNSDSGAVAWDSQATKDVGDSCDPTVSSFTNKSVSVVSDSLFVGVGVESASHQELKEEQQNNFKLAKSKTKGKKTLSVRKKNKTSTRNSARDEHRNLMNNASNNQRDPLLDNELMNCDQD